MADKKVAVNLRSVISTYDVYIDNVAYSISEVYDDQYGSLDYDIFDGHNGEEILDTDDRYDEIKEAFEANKE